MNDAQPFLDAICANHAEDAPRLVFADWLEDRGECARAEFIRVQIAIANARRDCLCRRCVKSGEQHHNGPCAASRIRITVDGRMQRADFAQRWMLSNALGLWCAWKGMKVTIAHAIHDQVVPGAAPFIAYYSRGFVASIHCTLADWCGGPCEKCNGEGGNDWDAMNTWNCTACGGNYDHRGTGTTTGHAGEICLRHPIESVTLTDRRPHPDSSGEDVFWGKNPDPSNAYSLPPDLWDLLDDYETHGDTWKRYFTEAIALAALNRAAVKLGRERAAKLRIARRK